VSGSRTLTMVDGAPFGRPTGSLVVGLLPDGRCSPRHDFLYIYAE
jgi:hypothetical protein